VGDVLVDQNGSKVEGTVVEFDGTYVVFKNDTDKITYRFNVSELSEESRAFLINTYATKRYDVEKLDLPLQEHEIRKYAEFIDESVKRKLKESKKSPTRKTDDYTFIRRAYLTIIGRIPSEAEVMDFARTLGRDRRKLINKLVGSPGYVSHNLNWWSDLLRIKDRLPGVGGTAGFVYREWVRTSIEENKPYDEIVRELVSTSGYAYDKETPQVGYYLRDRGMQLDNMANTVRVFLGTRLECAMCHNHPFDRWTQREFYEMAAFTTGVGNMTITEQNKKIGRVQKMIREEGDDRKLRSAFNRMRNIIRYGTMSEGSGEIRLPKNYEEENGKPNELINANAIFSPPIKLDTEAKNPKSREVFADWLTNEVNPRFTTVIVNRLWQKTFGIGLIEPIDNMMDSTKASNPELLEFLEKLMIAVDYDTREFLRVLYNTELFSRDSVEEDYESKETFLFAGPVLRRMTGEQMWDSLVTLVYTNVDERVPPWEILEYEMFEEYLEMDADELFKEVKRVAKEGRKAYEKKVDKNKAKFPRRDLTRASMLQYPAPGGHLIRQFGGSDKDQIENANMEPNTTQVLSLLNGFVETNVLNNKGADFIKNMQSKNSESQKIRSVFLAILGRTPDGRESSELKDYLEMKDGYKHVAWILLNSHEFMFIR
jgi:hypothetical protein